MLMYIIITLINDNTKLKNIYIYIIIIISIYNLLEARSDAAAVAQEGAKATGQLRERAAALLRDALGAV